MQQNRGAEKAKRNKDTGKCKTGCESKRCGFDLRFPAGPELSEPLIGSCNSALIGLGQSMSCRLASCDDVAMRLEVKNPIVSSVPGIIPFTPTHASPTGRLLLCSSRSGHRELLWQTFPLSLPHFSVCIDRVNTKCMFRGRRNLASEIQHTYRQYI